MRQELIGLGLAALLGGMVLAAPNPDTRGLRRMSAATADPPAAECDTRGLRRLPNGADCANRPSAPAVAGIAKSSVRAALVIGQGGYRVAGSSAASPGDARQVAAALAAAGWRVDDEADLTGAALAGAVARFTATLGPGDGALVYYSGLVAKAPAADGAGTENYLLGIDAAGNAPAAVAKDGLALSSVLAGLTAAGAGAEIVIVDAARPDRLEAGWSAPTGLAEPTSSALANAYIVFPAAPGRLAREGAFVPALVAALGRPGISAGQAFLDLSSVVERATAGQQTPWYSGSSASARIVVGPVRADNASAGVPDDARHAQAIACGTAECLQTAARAIGDPRLAIDLALRAEVAGAESVDDRPPQAASSGKARKQSYVDAFIESNRASPDGMRRIGLGYLTGSGGFPASADEAYVWLTRAASAGDGVAAGRLAGFFDLGKPPVGHVDKYEAVILYKQAAQAGEANAAWHLGLAYQRGEGGLPVDPALAAQWMAKARAAGDSEALAAGQ